MAKIIIGDELKEYVKSMTKDCYEARNGIHDVISFVEEPPPNRILAIFGLRRTGKTVMMAQAIALMEKEAFDHSAYVLASASDSVNDLSALIENLHKDQKIDTFFIDEVTACPDFIKEANIFSDAHSPLGMRIVLSGTDSLAFVLAGYTTLLDRMDMVHTTHIPFSEYFRLIDVDISQDQRMDYFLKSGGVLSHDSEKYFAEFKGRALAENIQHSLNNHEESGYFPILRKLRESGLLTSAIQKIIQDHDHHFALYKLHSLFELTDLAVPLKYVRSRLESMRIFYDKYFEKIKNDVKHDLGIIDVNESVLRLTRDDVKQIRDYLETLGLFVKCPVISFDTAQKKHMHPSHIKWINVQPGLRWTHVKTLVNAIGQDMLDNCAITVKEWNDLHKSIECNVLGWMMEDQVILETMLAYEHSHFVRVFRARDGDIDLVLAKKDGSGYSIAEIKHANVFKTDYKVNLENKAFQKALECFGKLEKKTVIYNGDAEKSKDVEYINVCQYLNNLPLYDSTGETVLWSKKKLKEFFQENKDAPKL